MAKRDCVSYRKAHPDEKGTESLCRRFQKCPNSAIARPIPMKRELKEAIEERARFIYCDIARPIPMKRELKDTLYIG